MYHKQMRAIKHHSFFTVLKTTHKPTQVHHFTNGKKTLCSQQPHTIRFKILLNFVLNSSRHCRRMVGNPDITYVITLEVFQ